MSTIKNGESRQCMVRVKLARHAYLEDKARRNTDNKYNHVATEINALIEEDYQRAQKRKRK